MKDANKAQRHLAITQAAYRVLAEKGYSGTSMLSIARASKASNETLYRWYGDKVGLFTRMVRDNAEDTCSMLQEALSKGEDPQTALQSVAPVLLEMLLGDRAISLNRAAASDASAELGKVIAQEGREKVGPLVTQVIEALAAQKGVDPQLAREWFFGLLIGDRQIRRVIGVMAQPSPNEIEQICASSLAAFLRFLDQSET
ncbi:MAG: TetR/AcrR family transcriptional regulator [Pseudomonadota bacterium]